MKVGLQISAVGTTIALMSVLFFWARKSSRNKKAGVFITVLQKQLKSSSDSIEDIDALSSHYLEKLLSEVTGSIITLKPKVAKDYAKMIHSAWRSWFQGGDDEDKVYSVLRGLKDRVQLAQVAEAYKVNYGTGLIEKIKERLDKKEIAKVVSIINRFPKYRTL